MQVLLCDALVLSAETPKIKLVPIIVSTII